MHFSVFSAFFNFISILAFLTHAANCGCQVENNINWLNCDGFQSWSDLNKMINNSLNPSATIIKTAYIQPNMPILLTSELDIASLLNTLQIKSDDYFILTIQGVSGIDVVAWPSGILRVSIEIDQSQIEFYINGKPLSDHTCSPDIMTAFLNSNTSSDNASFFNAFSEISFNYQNQYSIQPICPYIFVNATLDKLNINQQTGSNHWRFQSFDTNQSTAKINSYIKILNLQGYSYNLDNSVLNPLAFKSVYLLTIYGSISSIQPDLFRYFENLTILSFQLDDLESFFHQVSIDWTMSLNTDLYSPEVSFSEQNASYRYMYPDEDFCLIANFPTHKNIIPVLDSEYLSNCTSTIRWLLTYYFSHDMATVFNRYGDAKTLFSECELAWNQTLTNDPRYFEKKMVSQCHLTIKTTPSTPISYECSLSKFCTPTGWCENFASLIELNSTLLDFNSNCENYFSLNIHFFGITNRAVFINANKHKGPLNDQFNYELFLKYFFPNITSQGGIIIVFLGFDGIDFNFSSVYKSHALIKPMYLGFFFVFPEFNFYLNGEKVEMSSSCNDSELINTGTFSAASTLTFNFEYKSPDSSFASLCPYIFNNAELTSIHTIGKPLRFNQGSVVQSNIDIQTVVLEHLAVEYLNDEILNSQIYSSAIGFYISGTVKNIQIDVFKELSGVVYIQLKIFNFKGFIHDNGIEWMNYINYDSTPANLSLLEIKCDQQCLETLRSNIVSVQISMTCKYYFPVEYYPYAQLYLFPDEDFCIFANYPHNKSVLTIIEYDLPYCTCTITWLYKNKVLLSNDSFVNNEFNYKYGNACLLYLNDSVLYGHAFSACNFPDKIKNCTLDSVNLKQSFANYQDKYFYFYGIQSNLKQTQQIFNTYFNTWVLLLGLLANLIIAIVIINARHKADRFKNKKDNPLGGIDELFFTYMLINATTNLVYCLMMFFYQIFPCEPTLFGEIYQKNNCLVTNICISISQSILKLLANITYLQMSLNRYLLIGKDHAEWLKTIANANIVLVLLISFICSILLSYVIVDQQNLIYFVYLNTTERNTNYYYHSYETNLPTTTFSDITQFFENNLTRVIALTIVHDIFSYFLFCILNLIADVITVLKLKETLAEKARIGVSTKEKKLEQERAERRSVIMVVLNSLANVLFRIPELLSIIFFFIISDNKYIYRLMCVSFEDCNSVNQISDSFYNFTTVFNIFFYYFFNKTFKFAFHLIFSCCHSKDQKN